MIHGVYAVKDKAADAFIPPFFLPTDSMALREFVHACNVPEHKFSVHPYDYSLYKLATFDDNKGVIVSLVEPLFLLSADVAQTKLDLTPLMERN